LLTCFQPAQSFAADGGGLQPLWRGSQIKRRLTAYQICGGLRRWLGGLSQTRTHIVLAPFARLNLKRQQDFYQYSAAPVDGNAVAATGDDNESGPLSTVTINQQVFLQQQIEPAIKSSL